MKFRTIVIALLAIAFVASLFAGEAGVPSAGTPSKQTQSTQSNGAGSFGAETLDSISASGLVKLNRTIVSHHLSVNGSLIAHGATIGSIDVMGEANLTDTRIQNGGTILGSFRAQNTTIEKPFTINGQKATFTSSKLSGITVRPMEAFKGIQIIELRQKTVVNGPITFESGKGEVHLYPDSQVTGSITGGKIVHKR